MGLIVNVVDHRSPHIGFPSTSLSVLVSISTVSLGSLLLLGENPAYGYSDVPTVPDHLQATADDPTAGSSLNATPSNDESKLANADTFDSSLSSLDLNETSFVAETSHELNSDSSEYRFVDPAELESESIALNSSDVDLVQMFDLIAAQTVSRSQEPFIEISVDVPSDAKDVQSNAVALQSAVEVSQSSELEEETIAEVPEETVEESTEEISIPESSQQANDLGEPLVTAQGVYLLQGDESSARARLSGSYALTPNVLFGATLDLTTGDAFTNSPEEGFDLNELYVTVSPPTVPSLRLTLGMIDLTSYFDRNSFAKDAATHFFNPVFQTNPALAAAGIGSRPGVLVNWDLTDQVSLRGAAFSSDRDLDEFAFDAAAAEVAVRFGNFIVRGTYVTDRDAGQDSGFNEIFSFRRDDDEFGLESDDREIAYGINAEYFIPEINLGLFARYGWYENQALERGGNTYSFGLNALDLFFADDRLGLAYGRELSNESLRRDRGDDIPDVLELFYDVRLTRNFRVGASLQQRDGFSETIAGLRVRADFNLSELWR